MCIYSLIIVVLLFVKICILQSKEHRLLVLCTVPVGLFYSPMRESPKASLGPSRLSREGEREEEAEELRA